MENPAQRTDEWFIKRLGCFTGSMVGLLMSNSRTKGEIFSQTAMAYIYQVAAERDLLSCYKKAGDMFDMYREQIDITTKAMAWGTLQEPLARDNYEKVTGRHVVEVSSCVCKEIPYFASSPDGYIDDKEGKSCIEIKVPNQATYYQYKNEINDNESLKKIKPIYYYQCLSHIICTQADYCDFVPFNPFSKHPIHIVKILPDSDDISALIARIKLANDKVNEILNLK